MAINEITINDLREDLTTVIKKGDGDIVKIDMNGVFDKVEECIDEEPEELIMFLSQVKMGICNLAYDYEKKYSMKEDSFRVWKAEKNSLLNRTDDKNPLKQKNRKTTNGSIKAELRSYDKYKEYKDEMTKLQNYKNALWTAKGVIEDLIDFVKINMENNAG